MNLKNKSSEFTEERRKYYIKLIRLFKELDLYNSKVIYNIENRINFYTYIANYCFISLTEYQEFPRRFCDVIWNLGICGNTEYFQEGYLVESKRILRKYMQKNKLDEFIKDMENFDMTTISKYKQILKEWL